MGERKVLNKYFPPDFDPAKLPKGKRPDNNMMKVRMMLPMSIRCQTCGTYMYKGTKFNTRKEDVEGENYLGIQVFRFYFRCNTCAAEMTMKTDPEHADYTVEQGASRNYEPWRDKDRATAEAAAAREEEERGNAMKALENRTLDSKREMDIMNALDEMQSLKQRQERVDGAALLSALRRSAEEDGDVLDDDDEAAVKAMLMQQRGYVRRLEDGVPSSSAAGTAGAAAGGVRGAAVEPKPAPAAPRAPDAAAAPSSSRQGGAPTPAQAGPPAAAAPAAAAARPAPRPAAKRPALPLLVKAKRKAPEAPPSNGSSAAAAAEPPPGKRRDTAGEGMLPNGGGGKGAGDEEGAALEGGGGLGGLLGYGSGSSDSGSGS